MKIISFFVAAIMLADNVTAQTEKGFSATDLAFISTTMYDEGNINYLVVDALRDNLLSLNSAYTIMIKVPDHLKIMKPGQTKIEDADPISATGLKQQYLSKFEKFLEMHREEDPGFVVIKTGIPLTKNMVSDANSGFRSSVEANCFRAGLQAGGKRKLVAELLKDKLVTLYDSDFELVYSGDGILVNNTPLEGDTLEKYRNYFSSKLGIDLDTGQQSGRWYYEKGVTEAIK